MRKADETGGSDGHGSSVQAFSFRRVSGILLRHLYVLRRSWPRLLELAYWPTVQMILWGFVTLFFVQHSSWVAQAAGRADQRRAAVGHPVPRQSRRLGYLHGGDVGAQPGATVRQPAAAL